ncbi:MAG TPA: PHB depolymerase family esterase [Albitalea sp.]
MRCLRERVLVLTLAAATLAAFAPPGAAEEGPMRQWLKERKAQRQRSDATGLDTRITRPGDHDFTLEHDGLTRRFRVHVPATYQPTTPAPLLVALHGGGGSMDYQADDARYGQISLSERHGIVVVFPNGFSTRRGGRFATWNAGLCCGGARDNEVDDVGFIRQVVERITRRMNIDRQRIFATGMSNGAMLSYRLACEMPDVFKAIAAVAGTDNTRQCSPAQPIAVLHIHARNDSHVLFDGGAGPDARDPAVVTDFASVPDTVAKWVRLNGCAAEPRRALDRPGAYCDVYSPCRARAEVRLCVTETGGHSWPGGTKRRSSEPPSQAISANELMWEFFDRR